MLFILASSMEQVVANGKLPGEGLNALQAECKQRFQWAMNLRNTKIDEHVYRRFMDLFYACLYTFSPQGRVG